MFQLRLPLVLAGSVLFLLTTAIPVTSAAAAPPKRELCGPGSAINFVRSDFQATPKIDNRWFPLKPGMQFTLKGTVTSPDGVHQRKVVHTVTGLTKVIDGVRTLVMWDRDYADGELVESELAFFAQTRKGAVWLFGEYPEEYEDGTFVGAPSTFISGIAEAQAGIAMPAGPRTGTPAYVQAYAPAVDFLDCGLVVRKHQFVRVGDHRFSVLVIEEFNPLEPPEEAGRQRKAYAPGIGNIRVNAIGGVDQEELTLVGISRLKSSQLQTVNQQALEIDRRGYTVSKDVYAKTPPAEGNTSLPGS